MKKRQGLPSVEAVLNPLKHTVNQAQEGNDPNYKTCYVQGIIIYTYRKFERYETLEGNQNQIQWWSHNQYCNKSIMDIFNRNTTSEIK